MCEGQALTKYIHMPLYQDNIKSSKSGVTEGVITSQVANRHGSHIYKYIRAERLHVDSHHGWTQAAHRNRGKSWAMRSLASIFINAIPDVKVQPFSLSKDKLIRALTIAVLVDALLELLRRVVLNLSTKTTSMSRSVTRVAGCI